MALVELYGTITAEEALAALLALTPSEPVSVWIKAYLDWNDGR